MKTRTKEGPILLTSACQGELEQRLESKKIGQPKEGWHDMSELGFVPGVNICPKKSETVYLQIWES